MKVLIDNGHGYETPGKCSPDKKLREYKWAREIAVMLEKELKAKGIECERIVTEENDINLSTRCRRANAICQKLGTKNCVLVSIHINAAGADGKWHDARGWSGWVAPNASSNSKKFAQILYTEAEAKGLKGNRAVPKEKYWVGNFSIVKNTNCPAVLTENMFQDNKEDVEYLMSDKGKKEIVDLHVKAIIKYINDLRIGKI